jgi:DNA-nicking Smr family endonuclease
MSKQKPPGDDDDAFRDAMRDVKPIKYDKIAPATKSRKIKTRREADNPIQPAYATSDYAETTPEEYLFFHRGGLQDRRLTSFKRGELPIAASLDLHGQTVQHAAQALTEFLQATQSEQQQCVLVIHGRGYRSELGRPVIKAQIKQWLSSSPQVIAYCSAQPKHGGTGAVYVLLKRRNLT